MIDDQHPAPARGGVDGAHHSSRAGAQDHGIESLTPHDFFRKIVCRACMDASA
jgi:hypothetical protein